MAKRKSDQAEIVEVQEVSSTGTTSSLPSWAQDPKNLMYALGAVVVLFGGWLLYKNLVLAPKNKEALAAMWKAEQQFARDSFQLALNGTSDSGLEGVGFQGFAALADEYSGTPAGSACSYYAGVCNLNLGNYDEAISFLNNVDADGAVLPAMKYGLLGDAYSEKQDYSNALGYYEKAADAAEADVVAIYYLKKLGMLNEFQGNKDAALEAYERIRRDYPNQQISDWRDIEKYIYRLKPQM
ncbi:MAG: hypothetical protein RJA20_506 [Bacteroidota bacterium]|jgi:tetratricopeptide (TPR) repeat protein